MAESEKKEAWECEKCGKEFSSEKSAQKHESLCKKTKDLVGVEGWLWWSALVLTIISPAMILIQMSSDFSNGGSFINIVNILIIVASIIAGIMIFSQAKKAIIFTKGVYLSFFVLSIVDIGYYLYYSMILPSYLLQDTSDIDIFRNFFVCIFWLSYFSLSTRVKNTFKETKLGWKLITTICIASFLFFFVGFSIENNLSSGGEVSMGDIFTATQISNLDNYCSTHCSNVEYATKYTYELNPETLNVECQCIDDSESIVTTQSVPENVLSSYYIAPIQKVTFTQPKITSDSLSGGYVAYYPFTSSVESEIRLIFNSTSPVIVHFVLSEQDYQNFMKNLNYKKYEGCSFYNQKNKQISCNVSTGGVLVYNPNTETATYTITTG